MTGLVQPAPSSEASDRDGLIVAATAALALLILRLALAARIPVADDEAYYWLWSRHLSWGYPDHPPMIAALVALSVRIFGEGPLGIRLVPLLIASAGPLVLYAAGRALFDAAIGARGALLTAALPAVALGGVLAVPDTPLIFFWTLSLWAGWVAMRRGGWWWMGAGAAIGGALLSKLTAVFFAAGLAAAWGHAGLWRRDLRDMRFAAGVAVGAVLVLPVVLWNVRHDWLMVRTVLNGPPWITPKSVPVNLALVAGAQVAYYGPLGLLLLAAAVRTVARREAPWRFIAWLTLPVLVAVLLTAPAAKPKPHWPLPAYVGAAIAAAAFWPVTRRRVARTAAAATVALTLALTAAALSGIGIDVRGAVGRWDDLAELALASAGADAARTFVLADSYQTASQLAYRLEGRLAVTTLQPPFAGWTPAGRFAGYTVVYVDDDGGALDTDLAGLCRNVRAVGSVGVYLGRTEAVLYRCEDFTPPARTRSASPGGPRRAAAG